MPKSPRRKPTDHFKFTASSWRRVHTDLMKEERRLRAFGRSCPDSRADSIEHLMTALRSIFADNPPNYEDGSL